MTTRTHFLAIALVAGALVPVVHDATLGAQSPPTDATVRVSSRAGRTRSDTAARSDSATRRDSSSKAKPAQQTPTSPLTIHVGDADLLIGGFMDATAVYRSTNPGTGIGTTFGGIPFSNTTAGSLSETRFSAQNSRLTLTATSKHDDANLKGYLEADFLGNAAATLNITSNANTLRMRLYWVQYGTKDWDFLAGQSWSLLTPNRNGLSPMPGDLFYSQDIDTNYEMGLTWARTPGFRFTVHPSDMVTAAVALENPQQYVGTGVTLPLVVPAAEVDNGGNTATPNFTPDIIGKIAFDPKMGDLHQHIDLAVVASEFKTYVLAANTTFSALGTGFEGGVVLEPGVKQLHLIGNYYYSNGGGRYIANTNLPDFIGNSDGSISTVKSQSYIGGVEIQAAPSTLLYAYYSGAQATQDTVVDTNNKGIGFGLGNNLNANKTITEYTVGITQTFFRDPKIGGLQGMVQFSNVKRTPFSVPAGTPTDATTNMLFVNVRYVLP